MKNIAPSANNQHKLIHCVIYVLMEKVSPMCPSCIKISGGTAGPPQRSDPIPIDAL